MHSLSKLLKQSEVNGVAIGHFNVSDLVLLKSVVSSALELQVPVIVGVSDGERQFIGTRQISAVVHSFREEFDFPIFLNAGHTHSIQSAVEAATCGFDAITFDRSAVPFEQKILQTQLAIETLKSMRPDILVEGEIGEIGIGSEIHNEGPAEASPLTTPEEAKQYVVATGVDVLAPAVGNRHRLVKSMVWGTAKKHLDVGLIARIKSSVGIPLTLHGGSGTDDADLQNAIAAGINIIHINTEVRVAWRQALEEGLAQDLYQVVPYKILPFAVESTKRVVRSRLQLFDGWPVEFGGKPNVERVA